MNNEIVNDGFEEIAASETQKTVFRKFGQCFIETYPAVWFKGSQPERFDEQIHKLADRKMMIEIRVVPIDEMNFQSHSDFPDFRSIATSKEWNEVTRASILGHYAVDPTDIKATAQILRSLNGGFVETVQVPNGKFYTKKTTGEKKELSDFLFVSIFESQDACVSACLSEKAGEPVSALSDADFPAIPAQAAPSPVAAPNNDILLKFAQAIVTAAAKDDKDPVSVTAKVDAQLSVSPLMKGKYSAESPEVLEMIMTACQ